MDTENQELSNEREELKEVNLSEPGFLYNEELWFDGIAAAALMKISKPSFYDLLRKYKDMLTDYVIMIRGNKARLSKHISKKGLIVLMNVKDTNRHAPQSPSVRSNLTQADSATKMVKKEIAERAIDASTDPVLAQLKVLTDMRMEMLGMQEGLDEVREAVGLQSPKIEDHEQRIGGLETYINPMTSEMTQSQRSYLNSRVREYAFHMGVQYREVWSMLHDFVGRRSVDKYTMNDYSVAMGILKSKFKTASLPWSPNEYSKS